MSFEREEHDPVSMSTSASASLTYDEKRAVFCEWLKENGATFPKIQWPSTDTVGGCRGAVATGNIATNEVMMEIPIKLMMSPLHAFKDPVVGALLHASKDILRGDVLLTVYIMYEYLKGEESFYAPFLAILPEPGSIVQWSDSELAELQDTNITYRTKNRRKMLQVTYQRNVLGLSRRHPEQFPEEDYTYDLFLFAWFCVQARAFGRRLPWTALVPFADCLNHANVQTKYDYNIGNNGVFRMYPTGSNAYPQGMEVFNSYGKRPNDNLLLDYGFSILDNQWDSVCLPIALPSPPESNAAATSAADVITKTAAENRKAKRLFTRKKRMLFHVGFHVNSQFNLQRSTFPLDALAFARIASMNESELTSAEEAHSDAISSYDSIDENGADAAADTDTPPRLSSADKHHHILKVQNAYLELNAIKIMKQSVLYSQSQWDCTSIEEDESIMRELHLVEKEKEEVVIDTGDTDDENWKLVSAINYRLTRKRITEAVVEKIEIIEAYLRSRIARQRVQATVDNLTAAVSSAAANALGDGVERSTTGHMHTTDDATVWKSHLQRHSSAGSQHSQSPSRVMWADMQRVDALYSVNQPASGVSPYISTGSNTSFRGGMDGRGSANGGSSEGTHGEMRLRSYIQAITNEALPLELK